MYNITLVCTHHSEFGKCNSDELYTIIESIKPEIIFEELPEDLFYKIYKENTIPFETPETRAVKRYIKEYSAINIAVDNGLNTILLSEEIIYMFKAFGKYQAYKKLEDEQRKLAFEEGYAFLNSKKNEELFKKKKVLEKLL